jgi:hypothetical protein
MATLRFQNEGIKYHKVEKRWVKSQFQDQRGYNHKYPIR